MARAIRTWTEKSEAVTYLLLLFLITIGINWPALPYNARVADPIFILLAIAVLALPRVRWTWQWPDVAVACYLLGAAPAILISADRQQSAMEFVRQLYLVAIYVIFAIAARQGLARATGTGLALGGALLSIGGLVVVALTAIGAVSWPLIVEVVPLPYLGTAIRLRALTATQAMLACVLTAAVPFAIARCRSDRGRTWCVMAALMTMAALLTLSHAIAGFAVAVMLAAWPSLSARPGLRLVAVAAVVIVVLGLNFAATVSIKSISYGGAGYADASQYYYGVDQQETRIAGATVIYNVMSYARIKQVAWRAFIEHPVAGIGLDRFHSETMRAYADGRLPSHYRVVDPHSTLPGRMAECGVIGGITLLLLWAAWAAMARQAFAGGDPLAGAAAIALAGLVVSSLNADIMNFRFVWVLAGLLRGLQEVNGDRDQSAGAPNASTPLKLHGHAPR